VLSLNSVELVASSPISEADHQIAAWFHAHLAQPLINVMLTFSDPGSPTWIATITSVVALFCALRRHWYLLFALFLAVPGGMLLNSIIKELVHRHRPYSESPFVDLSDYSFPSGHAMAATLLYGLLAVFALLVLRRRLWRGLTLLGASLVILLVGFSRVALGAHYLTDVLAAMATGAVWIWLCYIAVERIRRRRARSGGLAMRRDPSSVGARSL
jgi:membrane-associated phospholipid phosphatase